MVAPSPSGRIAALCRQTISGLKMNAWFFRLVGCSRCQDHLVVFACHATPILPPAAATILPGACCSPYSAVLNNEVILSEGSCFNTSFAYTSHHECARGRLRQRALTFGMLAWATRPCLRGCDHFAAPRVLLLQFRPFPGPRAPSEDCPAHRYSCILLCGHAGGFLHCHQPLVPLEMRSPAAAFPYRVVVRFCRRPRLVTSAR
jgi:hypothetical protein